ncbi:MAG TPA: phosphatase PAP2 family protein, partial [Ktedonobacterales bacterium]
YVVAHQQPIVPIAHDNGFPSDHTLMAMVLTTSLWWLWRRFVPYFAVGTLLVMLGRLGIGAHHTFDVVGSVVIVLVVALVVGMLPLPRAWTTPIIGRASMQKTL